MLIHRLFLIAWLSAAIMGCAQPGADPAATPQLSPQPIQPTITGGAVLPNPASVYCQEQGYSLEFREGEGGTQGICRFPDGSECDEWAYFRGECQPGDSLTPTPAEESWQLYENVEAGYHFLYPPEATIQPGSDVRESVTIEGPLVEDDHWPMIYISHRPDDPAYHPPAGVDLVGWLIEHNLLMEANAQEPPGEVRQADARIGGVTAIHTRFDRSPQSYAYDKYFAAHAGQLYVIVIGHTGDREEWELYNRFLESFQFDS